MQGIYNLPSVPRGVMRGGYEHVQELFEYTHTSDNLAIERERQRQIDDGKLYPSVRSRSIPPYKISAITDDRTTLDIRFSSHGHTEDFRDILRRSKKGQTSQPVSVVDLPPRRERSKKEPLIANVSFYAPDGWAEGYVEIRKRGLAEYAKVREGQAWWLSRLISASGLYEMVSVAQPRDHEAWAIVDNGAEWDVHWKTFQASRAAEFIGTLLSVSDEHIVDVEYGY